MKHFEKLMVNQIKVKNQKKTQLFQQGSVLLEAMIAILIFSMGVLAVVGLQATSIKAGSDAKYRTQASFLANDLIAAMWVSVREPNALALNYAGTSANDGGPGYLSWMNSVSTELPGVSQLPPQVVFVGNQVTITIRWQLPGETDSHKYKTSAIISG